MQPWKSANLPWFLVALAPVQEIANGARALKCARWLMCAVHTAAVWQFDDSSVSLGDTSDMCEALKLLALTLLLLFLSLQG